MCVRGSFLSPLAETVFVLYLVGELQGQPAFIITKQSNSDYMARLLLYALILGRLLCSQPSVVHCHAKVIIDYRYDGYVELFCDENTSFPFAKVRNNLMTEDIVIIAEITGRTNNRFRVNLQNELTLFPFRITDVFIDKEHLVILSKVSEAPMPLYSAPSISSAVVTYVKESHGYTYLVMDCDGEWLKVSFTDNNGATFVGWMAPDYQCNHPFTACMGM